MNEQGEQDDKTSQLLRLPRRFAPRNDILLLIHLSGGFDESNPYKFILLRIWDYPKNQKIELNSIFWIYRRKRKNIN